MDSTNSKLFAFSAKHDGWHWQLPGCGRKKLGGRLSLSFGSEPFQWLWKSIGHTCMFSAFLFIGGGRLCCLLPDCPPLLLVWSPAAVRVLIASLNPRHAASIYKGPTLTSITLLSFSKKPEAGGPGRTPQSSLLECGGTGTTFPKTAPFFLSPRVYAAPYMALCVPTWTPSSTCLSFVHTPANGDPMVIPIVPSTQMRGGHIQKTGPLQEDWPREESCIGFWSGCRAISIGNVVPKVWPKGDVHSRCTCPFGLIWGGAQLEKDQPRFLEGSLLPRSKSKMDI